MQSGPQRESALGDWLSCPSGVVHRLPSFSGALHRRLKLGLFGTAEPSPSAVPVHGQRRGAFPLGRRPFLLCASISFRELTRRPARRRKRVLLNGSAFLA